MGHICIDGNERRVIALVQPVPPKDHVTASVMTDPLVVHSPKEMVTQVIMIIISKIHVTLYTIKKTITTTLLLE